MIYDMIIILIHFILYNIAALLNTDCSLSSIVNSIFAY